MKPEYDFSKGTRGARLASQGKTRISIYIDDTILAEFRARAEEMGIGYQALMNQALQAYLNQSETKPLTEANPPLILAEAQPIKGSDAS